MSLSKKGAYKLMATLARKILLPAPDSEYGWFGDYATWEEALKATSGYDNEKILEKVKNSLLKVRNGEYAYEQDGVLFEEIQYSWGALSGLLYAAVKNHNNLNVLDFGGSLGSGYFQNRKALENLDSLKWNIIEQEHFVKCGKEHFENGQLFFYNNYKDFSSLNTVPDVLLLSSVLQYMEHPYAILNELLSNNIKTIIVDITLFIDGQKDIISIQKVSPDIYTASYPAWFFNKNKFIRYFADKGYTRMGEWKFTYQINMGCHAGMIFNKI